jgi:hypothetical protein
MLGPASFCPLDISQLTPPKPEDVQMFTHAEHLIAMTIGGC